MFPEPDQLRVLQREKIRLYVSGSWRDQLPAARKIPPFLLCILQLLKSVFIGVFRLKNDLILSVFLGALLTKILFMAKQAKHQETKRWTVRRPFKGVMIGLVSQTDGGAAVPTISQLIDPAKVFITIKNQRTNIDVYNGPLLDFYRFLKHGDRDLVQHGSTNVADKTYSMNVDDYVLCEEMNLEFDTYDGDYQIIVDPRDSIPSGSRVNSYVTFNPLYSDEAMTYEAIYDDFSLDDKKNDDELGNGVEKIILLKTSSLLGNLNFQNDITRAGYVSHEISEEYDANVLRLHDATTQEEPNKLNLAQLCLLDGEALTNTRFNVEMAGTGLGWILMYKKLMKNPQAEASAAKADNRIDFAYQAIDNN